MTTKIHARVDALGNPVQLHITEGQAHWLKQFRRIATRYEKTLRHFKAIVMFASALVWLV